MTTDSAAVVDDMDNREYARAYYQAHKEQMKEKHRKWYQRNKEYYNQYRKRKRAEQSDHTYRRHVLYSVWNNYTDELVILDGNYDECAKAMGVSARSFHSLMTRAKDGKLKKWTFEKTIIKELTEGNK